MESTKGSTRTSGLMRRIGVWAGGIGLVVLIWLVFNFVTSGSESPAEQGTPVPGTLSVNVTDGQVFEEPVLVLSGSAPPEQLIFVNGQPIPVGADGTFELTLQLAEGPNLVQVEARDAEGATISLVRQVVYEVPGAEPVEGEEPAAAPAAEAVPAPWLLGLALGVILLAVGIVLVRRRRPWIQLTTDAERLVVGARAPGGAEAAVTLILELDRSTRVSLFVLNDRGVRVATLLNNRGRPAGRHTMTWSGLVLGEPVPPGKYTVLAQAGGFLARVRADTNVWVQAGPDGRS